MVMVQLTKGAGGRFEAAGVGWFKQRSMLSSDFVGEAAGVGALAFTRNWTGRQYTATDATSRVRGHHTRQGWGNSGPLEWDDVQYEFATHSMWRSSFALRRHSEDLATFTPKRFGRTIEALVLDHANIPPGLLLFCGWITVMSQRDAAAAS